MTTFLSAFLLLAQSLTVEAEFAPEVFGEVIGAEWSSASGIMAVMLVHQETAFVADRELYAMDAASGAISLIEVAENELASAAAIAATDRGVVSLTIGEPVLGTTGLRLNFHGPNGLTARTQDFAYLFWNGCHRAAIGAEGGVIDVQSDLGEGVGVLMTLTLGEKDVNGQSPVAVRPLVPFIGKAIDLAATADRVMSMHWTESEEESGSLEVISVLRARPLRERVAATFEEVRPWAPSFGRTPNTRDCALAPCLNGEVVAWDMTEDVELFRTFVPGRAMDLETCSTLFDDRERFVIGTEAGRVTVYGKGGAIVCTDETHDARVVKVVPLDGDRLLSLDCDGVLKRLRIAD